MATSADRPHYAVSVAVFWGLLGGTGVVVADEEQPDMEFLEYLGSWEASDEDWLLFTGPEGEVVAVDEKKRNDPAPAGEESPETDDES
jgi:hypothetical protein